MKNKNYTLEVCADSVASAVAAQEGGTDRIELCSALVIGGLSPSYAMFREVKKQVDLPIRVLLRPRFGDFCYDDYEFQTLKEEVFAFREMGADGVVIGILNPDGTLNIEQMKALVQCARPSRRNGMKITLHRAFDVCCNPYEALEQCIQLGVDTILTSGQKNSAWNGRDLLKELIGLSQGKIEILAGAGINPDVIEQLIQYADVTSFHMSGKRVIDSRMEFRREGVPMGIPGLSEYDIWMTDKELIRQAKCKLK